MPRKHFELDFSFLEDQSDGVAPTGLCLLCVQTRCFPPLGSSLTRQVVYYGHADIYWQAGSYWK